MELGKITNNMTDNELFPKTRVYKCPRCLTDGLIKFNLDLGILQFQCLRWACEFRCLGKDIKYYTEKYRAERGL